MKTFFPSLLLIGLCVGSNNIISDEERAQVQAKEQTQVKEIAELKAEVAKLKAFQHHYELRNVGSRVFRFDPATGETCIQLTTGPDWKNPETTRNGCPYQDYIRDNPETGFLTAECVLVGVKSRRLPHHPHEKPNGPRREHHSRFIGREAARRTRDSTK